MKDLTKAANVIRDALCSDPEAAGTDDAGLEMLIWKKITESADFEDLPVGERISVASGIFSSMRGYDVLDDIMRDPSVTEIMVNGHSLIFIERGGRVEKLPVSFESEKKLEDVIQRIVGQAGREVNRANPIVDTRLPDGSRVSVVLPPVSLSGPQVTIRRFPKEPMTFERLISFGSVTEEIVEKLRMLVVAGYNIFISGGTGSGKTSFLNALSGFIPPKERIVTVEDSAELKIEGIENLVRLETRNANSSGSGGIGMRSLIRASLRMRPERIIVGEVRGPEALDMLQAMNTGHDGSISTGHANSSADMLTRLETMVLEASPGLPLGAVRHQIASAIDVLIHLARMRDGSRKLVEISEVTGCVGNEIKLNRLYYFREDPDSPKESVGGEFVRTENPFVQTGKLEKAGITGRI